MEINNEFKTCCFTGYRPSKFPFPIDPANSDYRDFENNLTDIIFSLADKGVHTFYSGGAMGFDIIAAETVLLLRSAYKKADIKLCVAIPFIAQASGYDDEWRDRYNRILELSDEKIYVSREYSFGCYAKRNEYMVDKSDCVVTWYNGRSGGTKNTLKYAEKCGKKIFNIYKEAFNDHLNYDFFQVIDDIDD